MRDFQRPGRSAVYATGGMVATSQPLASAAALDVLRRGGNAVDAAVTAAAVLVVAEPHMTSLGGDCFAIVAGEDGALSGLNGSGRAPAALTPEAVAEAGIATIEAEHGFAVTVPGAVDAWARLLERFGTIGLDSALAPAIELAGRGAPVSPRIAADWSGETARLSRDPGARLHYLRRDGTAPRVGDVMIYPALAATLRLIAASGPEGFYRGRVADDIVAAVARQGGCLSLDDLAAVEATWVEPMLSPYRDLSVGELPPNGQGIVALLMLAILEQFDVARLDPLGAERLHLEIEAARLAYACRDRFLSDPDSAGLPAGRLLEREFAQRLAGRIRTDSRMDQPGNVDPRDATDTVYLCVVDGSGLAVSFINSLFYSFGSGIAGERSGVLLQNRGSGFVTSPGHPNQVGPRKRPMHTLIPGLLARDGRTLGVFGVMGGHYQACGHAHLTSNIVDYGMDPQAAIDLPRVFFDKERTMLERGVPEETASRLAALGHTVARREMPFGGGQMILIDRERGVLIGASDPRKDGCAIGF